jgi:hypothetical protein
MIRVPGHHRFRTREDVAQAGSQRQYEKFVINYDKIQKQYIKTLQRPRTSTSKEMSDIQRSDEIYATYERME